MLTVDTSHIIPNVNRAQFSAQYNPGTDELWFMGHETFKPIYGGI
jgi:hypothetical protein